MEPLVRPLGASEAVVAARAEGLREAFGSMNLFRMSLRQPNLAQLWANVVEQLVVGGRLDARLRELVILRAVWVGRGEYEWSNHYPFARSLGMTDAEIVAVRDWRGADAVLSADDRLVLEAADTLLDGRTLDADRVARLHEVVGGDGPLMELLALPGIYQTLALFTGTLHVALDEGRSPWEPDGVMPPAREP